MIKKVFAIVIVMFLGLSLILSTKFSKREVSKEEDAPYIMCKDIAGVSYARIKEKSFDKCVIEQEKSFVKCDYELICRTVYCEAGNQNLETQTMVALTILNRVADKRFPNTIKDVIYQKNAYVVTTWKNFEQYGWTKQVENAVNRALESNNYPKDMFYFRTEHYHKFGEPYIKSDDLWFSTEN